MKDQFVRQLHPLVFRYKFAKTSFNLDRIGGRGLLLIGSFMDSVRHNARGNQIIMVKCVSTPKREAGEARTTARCAFVPELTVCG